MPSPAESVATRTRDSLSPSWSTAASRSSGVSSPVTALTLLRRFGRGVGSGANFADRIPKLAPRFGFTGFEKGKVRLVVGIDSRHEFDVRAVAAAPVGICQEAVPCVAKFVVSPRPLFFAGRDLWVGDMDESGLGAVVVTAEKRLPRSHAHIRGRDGNIGVPREIVGRV